MKVGVEPQLERIRTGEHDMKYSDSSRVSSEHHTSSLTNTVKTRIEKELMKRKRAERKAKARSRRAKQDEYKAENDQVSGLPRDQASQPIKELPPLRDIPILKVATPETTITTKGSVTLEEDNADQSPVTYTPRTAHGAAKKIQKVMKKKFKKKLNSMIGRSPRIFMEHNPGIHQTEDSAIYVGDTSHLHPATSMGRTVSSESEYSSRSCCSCRSDYSCSCCDSDGSSTTSCDFTQVYADKDGRDKSSHASNEVGPSARLLESHHSGFAVPSKMTQEDFVATRIQACWRGSRGRRLAVLRLLEFEMEMRSAALDEIRYEACVRIQALARGFLTRTRLQRKRCTQPYTVDTHKPSAMEDKVLLHNISSTVEAMQLDKGICEKENEMSSLDRNEEEGPLIWPDELNLEAEDTSGNEHHSVTYSSIEDLPKLVYENKLKVFCGTWNLGGQLSTENLRSWIEPNKYHIVTIGTEECGRSIAQSVLFSSKEAWEDQLKITLGIEYTPVASHTLTAIHNIVFAHQSVLPLIHDVCSSAVPTGLGNKLGNKGGIGISFTVGRTSFAFINCHFEAHQSKVTRRNANFDRINNELKLRRQQLRTTECASEDAQMRAWTGHRPVSKSFDRVFWFGDLNYRINGTREMVDRLLKENRHDVLYANDQLRIERERGHVFNHFMEGPVNFRPTYRYDIQSDNYDTSSKQRIPAWTDRILYLSNDKKDDIHITSYQSKQDYRISDHRPVSATFIVKFQVKEMKQTTTSIKYASENTKSEACNIQ